MPKKFLEGFNIAHRGLYDNYSGIMENTIPAFKRAIEENYAIEMDVRLTLDDMVVVYHDGNLKRLTKYDTLIKRTQYKEIIKLNKNIPTLKEALDCISGSVPIIIELKTNNDSTTLVDKVMSELKDYEGVYYIKSFDYKAIKYLKKKYPKVTRGLLISSKKTNIINLLLMIILSKPNFISCDKLIIAKKSIQRLKKKVPVIAWTAYSDIEKSELANYSDNVIIDRNKAKEEFQNIKTPEELHNFMKKLHYMWITKDGKISDNDDNFFDEYRLQIKDELLNTLCGVCWDYVELSRFWFKNHGYEIKTLFEMIYLDGQETNYPTHTFLIYKDKDSWHLFDREFDEYHSQNIEEIKTYQKKKYLENIKENINEEDLKNFIMVQYTEPKRHMSADEYLHYILKNIYINKDNR